MWTHPSLRSCDIIFSRMVYHMLSMQTAAKYTPQFAAALRPGGKLLFLDHNPADGTTGGPRTPMSKMMPMVVVPQETEKVEREFTGPLTSFLMAN
jgi:predicted methyltransferase